MTKRTLSWKWQNRGSHSSRQNIRSFDRYLHVHDAYHNYAPTAYSSGVRFKALI